MSRFLITFIAVAALAACGNKKEQPAATSGSATAVTTSDAAAGSAAGSGEGSAAAAAAEPLDVPTEVDFEESASAEITDKNVEARVKAIEAELQQ